MGGFSSASREFHRSHQSYESYGSCDAGGPQNSQNSKNSQNPSVKSKCPGQSGGMGCWDDFTSSSEWFVRKMANSPGAIMTLRPVKSREMVKVRWFYHGAFNLEAPLESRDNTSFILQGKTGKDYMMIEVKRSRDQGVIFDCRVFVGHDQDQLIERDHLVITL
jgi:hypothetical protein